MGRVTVARKGVRRLAGTVLALVAVGTAAGCASVPQPTPELSPTAAAALTDQRITLPTTMGLAFDHPRPGNRVEHQVLYTVQQSVRAQLHAEYGPGAADPLLSTYWSGDGLAAVRADVASWAKQDEQPVGVLVLSDMTYTPPDDSGHAAVSYCASWQNVVRGNATTHVVGSVVQKAGTPGTYTTLTVQRAGDGRWQVSKMAEAAHSSKCAAAEPGKKK
jgi:hypothetical protein